MPDDQRNPPPQPAPTTPNNLPSNPWAPNPQPKAPGQPPEPPKRVSSPFERELESLINRYSQENDSNTPDFILAEHLVMVLAAWNVSVRRREQWYGRRHDGPASIS